MKFNSLLLSFVLLLFISCEDYGKEKVKAPVIRAGEALKITNTPLSKDNLNNSRVFCSALENYHDNILRNVFSEDFVFNRRVKKYGETQPRDYGSITVYIDPPNDYSSTPFYKGRYGTIKNFIDEIPTENNLYLNKICDYVLNNVGQAPLVQEQVGSRYHVFNIISADRVDVGIYTKSNDSNYYLYRSHQYKFNINSNSRYYGMVTEQSEVFIKDSRGSDYSVTYQSFDSTRN